MHNLCAISYSLPGPQSALMNRLSKSSDMQKWSLDYSIPLAMTSSRDGVSAAVGYGCVLSLSLEDGGYYSRHWCGRRYSNESYLARAHSCVDRLNSAFSFQQLLGARRPQVLGPVENQSPALLIIMGNMPSFLAQKTGAELHSTEAFKLQQKAS